VPGWSL